MINRFGLMLVGLVLTIAGVQLFTSIAFVSAKEITGVYMFAIGILCLAKSFK